MDRVRHLPRGEDGKEVVFVTACGGMLDELADTLEDHILRVARQDARRARGLAEGSSASPEELRAVLGFLATTVLRLAEMVEDARCTCGDGGEGAVEARFLS